MRWGWIIHTLRVETTEGLDELDERETVLLADELHVVAVEDGDHRREDVLYELLRRLLALRHRVSVSDTRVSLSI